jgi:hypothetical protein
MTRKTIQIELPLPETLIIPSATQMCPKCDRVFHAAFVCCDCGVSSVDLDEGRE